MIDAIFDVATARFVTLGIGLLGVGLGAMIGVAYALGTLPILAGRERAFRLHVVLMMIAYLGLSVVVCAAAIPWGGQDVSPVSPAAALSFAIGDAGLLLILRRHRG